jgi:hypothetical protein
MSLLGKLIFNTAAASIVTGTIGAAIVPSEASAVGLSRSFLHTNQDPNLLKIEDCVRGGRVYRNCTQGGGGLNPYAYRYPPQRYEPPAFADPRGGFRSREGWRPHPPSYYQPHQFPQPQGPFYRHR